jgi:hypothetical protein
VLDRGADETFGKSGAATLPGQATAWPPAARMAATSSSRRCGVEVVDDHARAFGASFIAIARPMPRPEPVTRATLSCSFFMRVVELSGQGDQASPAILVWPYWLVV